ncbi:MAG: hypothetical protein QOG23_2367 [Blastocatellia bacterium]|jgi:hypothetical protein|nr:hypothetical protein [Blastocatellia bacterium]
MVENFVAKYPAEFFLEFRSVDRFIYRVSDLYSQKSNVDTTLLARLDNCHLYLICTRPRLALVPGSIEISNEFLYFDVDYRLGGNYRRAAVALQRKLFLAEEEIFEISGYPHRELISRDRAGEIVAITLLANFVHLMPTVEEPARDLEVRYVGKGLHHSAQDRLEHHATLQKILADINSNEPDSEVFALVYALEFHKNAYSPGLHRKSQEMQ